ncbi:unnamed protein product [Cylicocyclus nassatus]|uniref:Bestrophin homolog n=1 Tax=Cylicocyclus nassatus TaxID=53992 RepID=A0AA36GZ42_CYLNA|nr:unnamed protein product [Cylicocyclus nassatus]
MTVQYSLAAATATGLTFMRLLRAWRGSVWKLVAVELLVWEAGCILLTLVYYNFIKGGAYDKDYCSVIVHTEKLHYTSSVLLILGFFTKTCIDRWTSIYQVLMLWPENIAMMFSTFFKDDALPPATSKAIRHSIYRWLLLAHILVLRDMSIAVKKQFPTYQHLVKAQLLTEPELYLFEHANIEPDYCRYWIPLTWISETIKKYYVPLHLRGRGRKTCMDHAHFGLFMEEMVRIRQNLGDLLCYDWIPIPLATTQTITFSVYVCIILDGVVQHSSLCDESKEWDVVSLIINFVFHLLLNTFRLGWLKCGQVILNPFGLDDDDYEANSLIDMYQRNLAGIITRPDEIPPVRPLPHHTLPHTVASALLTGISDTKLTGSMATKVYPKSHQEILR